jgi:2-haloacid dehalogenase
MTESSTPPKAIVFDLLTALLDSWTAWDLAASQASSGSPEAPSTPEQDSPGKVWRKHYLDVTYGCGKYRPYEDLVREAAKLAGLPPSAPAALTENWDTWIKPWPEVPSILGELKGKGYKLAVVTNCSNELGYRAAALCGAPFDVVVTAEEVGWYKPAPEAYQLALEKIGIKAEDALFVAGSSSDVPGAAGVGMKVVWHNRVGLDPKEGATPEREGRTLNEALEGYL